MLDLGSYEASQLAYQKARYLQAELDSARKLWECKWSHLGHTPTAIAKGTARVFPWVDAPPPPNLGPISAGSLVKGDTSSLTKRPKYQSDDPEVIGSGADATVYRVGDDPNLVVKVIRPERETGWVEYVKWCQKNHPDSPHAPKVHHLSTYVDDQGKTRTIAIMQRYVETLYNASPAKGHPLRKAADNHNFFGPLRNNDHYDVTKHGEASGFPRSLIDFVADLQKWKNSRRRRRGKPELGSWDLHAGNIMVAQDGVTLVVTDPFY
mgnify:FL=1